MMPLLWKSAHKPEADLCAKKTEICVHITPDRASGGRRHTVAFLLHVQVAMSLELTRDSVIRPTVWVRAFRNWLSGASTKKSGHERANMT